ncbi:hypothetical protein F4561_001040 [Lipingzhangella halophila]|uniref:Uncharacterized protein n=1 Tax=Lipingzhangella halophila TaxID=1783352 RepID=A0A7W7RDZ8_9ACTN|nr:hypothetical protein [Lipingzhangella halophila]MBB4930220.1 hypothetical protein [Lipingzhangella halophila]
MNTSPKSNDNQTAAPERDDAPVLEEPASHDSSASPEETDATQDADSAYSETEDETEEEWGADVVPAGTSQPTGIFTAETFAITGLLAISTAIVGTRMTESLPTLVGQSQEGMFAGLVLGDGVIGLLAVIFAAVSLLLANRFTHPWARWVATATIIVGIIFIAASVITYMQIPEPQPQPPMMPAG